MAIYYALGTEEGHPLPGFPRFTKHEHALKAGQSVARAMPNMYGDSLFVIKVTTQVVSNRVQA